MTKDKAQSEPRTAASPARLSWRRKDIGKGLKAAGAGRRYFVTPHPLGGYTLEVFDTRTVGGSEFLGEQIEDDHHSQQRMAKAVAAAYEALGNDYRPADHGHKERMTSAVLVAYDAARKPACREEEPPMDLSDLCADCARPLAEKPSNMPGDDLCADCRTKADEELLP